MKKIIKIFLIILVVVIIIPMCINFYVVLSTMDYIKEIDEIDNKYDIGMILGCSVTRDNKPSKMLADRLNKGIELYENKKIDKLLITGDHKEGYSEVEVMYDYLIEHNIPSNDILLDKFGYSTSESLLNYNKEYKNNSVIIVTQKYHLYRSLFIASRLNLNAIGVKAKEINYPGNLGRELREILARNKDFIVFIANNWD